MKFLRYLVSTCTALALCAAIEGCGGKSQTQSTNSAIPALTFRAAAPSLTTGVPLAMIVNQLDSAHGITVDLQAFGTSSTISIDAVLGGHAMFGSVGTLTALQAIRQGADLRIIGAIVNNVQVMVIRNDVVNRLGISSTALIADRMRALKGLTIATGAVGSTHYQILRSYLRQYGLDPDKDVRLIGMSEPSALVTGLEQQRFDAIAYASPLVELAIARNVGQVWISGPRGDIPGSENIKTGVIVVRTETLEKNRQQVDALREALSDALHSIQNDPAATGKRLHDLYFSNLDQNIWQMAWSANTTAYPSNLAFTRAAFEYWINNDPKGRDSYNTVDYNQITYGEAQSK
jgi:NitT/TauT family transport system substrate-binding protein